MSSLSGFGGASPRLRWAHWPPAGTADSGTTLADIPSRRPRSLLVLLELVERTT